jgi:hypothetical protein
VWKLRLALLVGTPHAQVPDRALIGQATIVDLAGEEWIVCFDDLVAPEYRYEIAGSLVIDSVELEGHEKVHALPAVSGDEGQSIEPAEERVFVRLSDQ